MNLSKNVKISQAITVTNGAAAATDIDGAVLDMQGYIGVLIVVTFGAIVTNAVTGIRVEQGAAADLSDGVDLEGSAQAVADDDDEQTFVIDLYRPTERYVRLIVDRATQNATVASALYIQYGAREQLASYGSAVNAVELLMSPDEGTA